MIALTTQIWWFLSRGSGIVAWAMLAATNLWGILMMTRIVRTQRPAWMLDLHRWLGALAIITTGVHLGGLVADSYVHFGWTEILVPNGSPWKTGAVTWGVIAFYLMIIVQATSLVMKRLPRRLWHSVHLLSYVLFGFATVHGALAGTDSGNRVYVAVVALAVSAIAIGVLIRILRRHRRPTAPATQRVHRGTDPAIDSAVPVATNG